MARIDFKICIFVFGLVQLQTVTGQTATVTSATVTSAGTATSPAAPVVVVPPGKDQSTIVWAVSTDPLDPALSGTGGTEGQAPASTSVIPAAASTQPAVAIVTTPAFIRQETTTKVVTSAPVIATTPPAALTRAPPTSQPRVVDVAATPNMKADVTDTVMALLNETGYYGSANDANVQYIVDLLLNGSVPTDADLMRLGMVPQLATTPMPTPPPYSFAGNQPPLDTSVGFPSNNQPTGTQTGPTGGSPPGNSGNSFPNPGYPMPSFPGSPPLGTGTSLQSQPQTGPGTGGTDPFGGALSGVNPGGMQNFLSMMAPPATSPKPTLGDPFSMNTINGAPQMPNMGPIDPNALGPKPNMGSIGGLGTPGSTTDLLGPLPPGMGGLPTGMGGLPPGMGGLPPGMGGLPGPPPTGILDAPPPRNRGGGMNPMMMMMMMNPELMDQMMSGENPMLMMMMMQQMNKRPQRPRPLPTSGMGPLGGFPGGAAGVGGLPMPGQPSMGGGPGGVMDMMNPLSAAGPALMGGPGGAPMDLSALTGLGAGMGPTPGAPVNPMDLIQGSLTSSAGPGVPPTDLLPFPGMGAGMAGPIPSGAPITDPFAATVG